MFYKLRGIFPRAEGNRIIFSNEQNFFSYYMINHRIRDISFNHYLEYFSRIYSHAGVTTPPPTPPFSPSLFSNRLDTRKIYFFCHTFYVTFQPSTTAQSVRQNNFIFHFKFSIFMRLQRIFYVLSIIWILCPIAKVT